MINLIHIHKYIHIYYTNIIHAYSADIHTYIYLKHTSLSCKGCLCCLSYKRTVNKVLNELTVEFYDCA